MDQAMKVGAPVIGLKDSGAPASRKASTLDRGMPNVCHAANGASGRGAAGYR